MRSLLPVSLPVARAFPPAPFRASRCAATTRRLLPWRLPPPRVAWVASVAFCSISSPRGAARVSLFLSPLAPVVPPPPRPRSSVAVPRRLHPGRRGKHAILSLLLLRCHPAPHLHVPSHRSVASHCAYGCRLSCDVRGWCRTRCRFSRARPSRRGKHALFSLLLLRCHPAPHLHVPSHRSVASHCAYGCRLSCNVRGWRRMRC